MPVYSFICSSCSNSFQKFTSSREVPCPNCSAISRVTPVSTVSVASVSPQKSGSTMQYDMDRVIGEDATEKWKGINSRQQKKSELRQSNPDSPLLRIDTASGPIYSVQDKSEAELSKSIRERVHSDIKH